MTFLHASSLLVLFAFSLAIPSKHMVKRSTALSELVDNGEYFGCYSTTSWLEGAIKTDMGETASNIHCQSICQQSGFIFAAIHGILKHSCQSICQQYGFIFAAIQGILKHSQV